MGSCAIRRCCFANPIERLALKGVPHRGRKQISAISAVRFTTQRLESPALSATWLVVTGAAIEDGVGEIP
jgi:hypothetical protein